MKTIEELPQNLELNKVSIKKSWMRTNKKPNIWSSLFANKIETLITDNDKVQRSVTDKKSKIEMRDTEDRTTSQSTT